MIKLHERYARLFGIPGLGIFLSFIFCEGGEFPSFPMILKSIAFVFTFWQGLFFIITYFRKQYPKIRQTNKRLFFSIISASIYIVIADFILRGLADHFYPELIWFEGSLLIHMGKNFFISFLVAMIYELTYFYARWNQSTLETEQLKTQQIASQLESLKNQISPHFLFNSLNTLAAIIPEDQEQAVKFTEKLSEVYRYILQYKDKELVQLKTELDFIKSYLFLLKIRYPKNLTIEYSIDDLALNNHVAPLTLQILVENAIKHNVISKLDPLTIKLYTDERGNVVVENQLKLKTIAKNSTKMGLENIRKRYEFLTNRSIEIINNNQYFQVTVPLIHFDHEMN